MPNATQTTKRLRVMQCSIGDETYGLDMAWVRSVQRSERMRRDAGAANPTESSDHAPAGWLSDNGGEIPVFSLANRLERPRMRLTSAAGHISASERVVVLEPPPSRQPMAGSEPGPAWALLVDRAAQPMEVSADEIIPLPAIAVNPSAEYFQGALKLDRTLMLFLAPERLHPRSPTDAGEPAGQAASPEPSSDLLPGASPPVGSAGGRSRGPGQILVFRISPPHPSERALSFGLSISQVPEILELPPIVPVPGADPMVLGLVNWRGWPVPVVDLAGRLGLTALPTDEHSRLVIACATGVSGNGARGTNGTQATLIGLLVQPAVRVLRLPVAHRPSSQPLPFDSALARTIVETEGETLVVPDLPQTLRVF